MPDLHDRLNAALAGHYAIERELGSGGMATVWLAKDLRYGRAVAVKVLRPDLSAALGSDRFATPGEFADALQSAAAGALTIGAVEQVAAQVGIPPQHVRQAVRDLVAPVLAVPSPFATAAPSSLAPTAWPVSQGKPGIFDRTTKTYAIERSVEREVTAAEHSALVLDIHEMLRLVGHGSAVGDALTWSPAAQGAGGRQVVISVTPAEGRTRIRVEERLNLSAERLLIPQIGAGVGGMLGLLGVGMGGVFGHVEGPLMVLPIALLAGFGAMSATRIYQTTLLDRRAPELRALAERLAVRIASKLPALPGPGPSPSRG